MASSREPGEIAPHMPVVGSDGQPVGQIDHLDGDRLKLTRDGHGQHHWLPRAAVAAVERGQVVLDMTAAEAKTRWEAESMPGSGRAGSPGMAAARQDQRGVPGDAEAGRSGGQRQGGSAIGPMGAEEGGANDVAGGTGMTRDPI